MHKQLLVALLSTTALACSGPQAAPTYVAGQPISFPVEAGSALEHLGRSMLVNCESEDASIRDACVSGMEIRIESCAASRPATFTNSRRWRSAARVYLACVMPVPICRGIEITSDAQMHEVCGQPA